jgi:hypothetical protein
MKIDCIIGIDPGSAGGIAIFKPGQPLILEKMPKDLAKLKDFMEYHKSISNPLVFIEKLNVQPGDMNHYGKMVRIQKMLGNFEQLKNAMEWVGLPFVLVHPQKWQATLKLRLKGIKEEKTARKARYRDTAQRLYPEKNIVLWGSDATLLMHFGRYMVQNDQSWILQQLPAEVHNTLF